MTAKSIRTHLVVSLLLPWLGAVHAQTLPDAGSIRQQIEQPRMLPSPQAAPEHRVVPAPEPQPQGGTLVRVTASILLDSRAGQRT